MFRVKRPRQVRQAASPAHRNSIPRRRVVPFLPRLEALEGRWVPATVTNLLDSGAGSLRQALLDTPAGGIVDFQPGLSGTITLTSGHLTLARDVSIYGPGAGGLTVSGNNARRVFVITADAAATISGLTIANGLAFPFNADTPGGGGIMNSGRLDLADCAVSNSRAGFEDRGFALGGGIYNRGTLTLTHCTVDGNQATFVGFPILVNARGGGILNTGTLTVVSSSVRGNSVSAVGRDLGARAFGGGIFNGSDATLTLVDSLVSENTVRASTSFGTAIAEGGGIHHAGTAAMVLNSTVSGNQITARSSAVGGGIHAADFALTVTGSTVAGNSAGVAGGILSRGGTVLRNTLVAGNVADQGPDVDGPFASQGHNLVGDSTGGSGFTETDLLDMDPVLGPLQDNGGPTLTHALLPGSPAIDAGDNTDAPEFDQRGQPRITGNVIDIGAYEVQPGPALFFYLVAPESALAGVPFDLLVVAFDADGYVATNYTGTVAFYPGTDPDAVLPEAYTFTTENAGWVYFFESAVLYAEGAQEVWVYDVETFAVGVAVVQVFAGGAPGGDPSPPWAHGSDVAALLTLLAQQPRVRP